MSCQAARLAGSSRHLTGCGGPSSRTVTMVTTAKEFLAWYALGAFMEMDVGGLPFVLFLFLFGWLPF